MCESLFTCFIFHRKGSFVDQIENSNPQKEKSDPEKSETHPEKSPENNKKQVLKQNNKQLNNQNGYTSNVTNRMDNSRQSWTANTESDEKKELLKSKLTLQFDENFESFLREEEVEMEEESHPVEAMEPQDTRFLKNKGFRNEPDSVHHNIDLPVTNGFNQSSNGSYLVSGQTYTVNFSAASQNGAAPERKNKVNLLQIPMLHSTAQ